MLTEQKQRVIYALRNEQLPHWAKYATQDEDGLICVFEFEPFPTKGQRRQGGYWYPGHGRVEEIKPPFGTWYDDWKQTLTLID